MNKPRKSRAEARAQMREAILKLGKEQLETRGAANLSVREIARGLGIASSAIYRHVSSRDELLTMLLVEAYTELASTALSAADAYSAPGEQLEALAAAMHTWAVGEPASWGLIYGTPVPDYAAPVEATTVPGTRVMARFVEVLAQGSAGTADVVPPSDELTAALREGSKDLVITADVDVLARALTAWSGLIGLISAEVFGHFGAGFGPVGSELISRWVAEAKSRFGL